MPRPNLEFSEGHDLQEIEKVIWPYYILGEGKKASWMSWREGWACLWKIFSFILSD
ncbi:hypothetical protein HPP92_022200 [Vanilla planifolia]|uniref:Uncharacterized protein n=1 Tax=Vanilla planifolia TaxID=51239 RepID=A0A835UDA7_VANPL|nr:hypothetical protein HPP92_022200 [Vanilla planifolia]